MGTLCRFSSLISSDKNWFEIEICIQIENQK